MSHCSISKVTHHGLSIHPTLPCKILSACAHLLIGIQKCWRIPTVKQVPIVKYLISENILFCSDISEYSREISARNLAGTETNLVSSSDLSIGMKASRLAIVNLNIIPADSTSRPCTEEDYFDYLKFSLLSEILPFKSVPSQKVIMNGAECSAVSQRRKCRPPPTPFRNDPICKWCAMF